MLKAEISEKVLRNEIYLRKRKEKTSKSDISVARAARMKRAI